MAERLLTPSKITAWLDCAHVLTLQHRVDDGTLTIEGGGFGSLSQLLMDKGLEHETDCLQHYRDEGLTVFEVPDRDRDRHESFAKWVERVGDPFGDGHDVIYQMPFIHDGVRGIADFLLRVEDPDTGAVSYEPVDAKLARAEAKPGHVLQLCFYADALQAATGTAPEHLHLWLGSGHLESLRSEDVRPYWKRLRGQLKAMLDQDPDDTQTRGEPCDHCAFCTFAEHCENEWRDADSLHYVAGLRRSDQAVLEAEGVETLAQLATCAEPIEDLQPERLRRLVGQAELQVEARTHPDERPPFQIIEPGEDPTWGHGFEHLPEPDYGDVFLDFEGHPFWRADTGLFFLFGYIERDEQGDWVYVARWAHDLAEEADATRELIETFTTKRAERPGMHVYHYNHTERSALQRLATDHGVGEAALTTLIETGLFVDLYPIARNALQVGTESYGLKHLEQLAGFVRGDDIHQGAGAVVEYEAYTRDHDPASLDRIAAYNEDDVRATRALRDWLIDQRPADLDWRVAEIELDEEQIDLDEQVAALHAFGPDTPEHLLGDLLGYWLRELRANRTPKLAKIATDTPTLLDDPEVLAGLTPIGLQERTGKNGRVLQPVMAFHLPEQEIADKFFGDRGTSVLYATVDAPPGYASVARIDPDEHILELAWNERAQELGTVPGVVVRNDWVAAKPKPQTLLDLADRVLDPATFGAPSPLALALLRRDLPAFTAGDGPANGVFEDVLDDIVEWAQHLDHSFVAIQGPPGTGKTYRGAHIVHALVKAGLRVGITAFSHHAIDNLVEAAVRVFEDAGDLGILDAVRRGEEPADGLPSVTYAKNNKAAAKPGYNLVAGTTWLFAGTDMADAPVDVLIIDEAGQLALADALAATNAAHNLILLGDPLQLAQVAQAAHPNGSGASVLEHVLGEHRTLPNDRGVFLAETRRLHPDVCRFISKRIYDGRLTSHSACAQQTTEAGTGLRWLRADHDGNATESAEEAEIVAAEIARLVGTDWTNQHGVPKPLGTNDFMVVAPYNDQVDLIRERLDADPATHGVPVGTVDKFQGREAAIVFFTMTTSSSDEMTRGADFLFSRNRLNVAISRARCLAYLVCTEDLLNTRARNVDEMRLIATLCAFVERAADALGRTGG